MDDNHMRELAKLCRLCQQEIKQDRNRKPCSKGLHSGVIRAVLNIDVDNEDHSIYPPFLCRACDLKIVRFKKIKSQSKQLNIQPADFAPHQPSCVICGEHSEKEAIFATCEELAKGAGLLQSKHCDRTLYVSLQPAGGNEVKVEKCITIFPDLTWTFSVYGHEADLKLPSTLTSEIVTTVFARVSQGKVCAGIPDMVNEVVNKNLKSAYIECGRVELKGSIYDRTVRHRHCKLLIDEEVCGACKVYRSDIISMRKKENTEKTTASSTTKLTSLSRDELIERCKTLQDERRLLKRTNINLRQKIEGLMAREGVPLNEQQSAAMKSTLTNLEGVLEEDSPGQLLWEEQVKAVKRGKNVRWHPAIIRWCIAVQSKSASAFKVLREAGFLRLPHETTLQRYKSYTDAVVGIQHESLEYLLNEIDLSEEKNKNVMLIMDEMKLKSGLVYSSSSGELIGFTDVGDINNEIQSFTSRISGEDSKEKLASHAFTLMVRGIFKNFQQAVAFFPSCALNNSDIYETVWHTVSVVETRGLKVRGIVADGALPNRKFYKISASTDDSYWCVHPLDRSRKIYFFCDVPHLLKTTRNNLENSGYGRKSRNLKFEGKDIRWTHIMDLYEWDLQQSHLSPGLRKLPRLTHEHLHLTPSLRMRVKLAAQVLSRSVANAMELMEKPNMDGTKKFINMFNQFFDCLNVSTPYQGIRKRNNCLYPYRTEDDWRFEWLENVFLKYVSDWEEEVQNTPNLSAKERERRCISRETREGLKITVKSFTHLTRDLLKEPGIEYVLSEKFSQDPLEEYFSKQRGIGGSSDNPTVQQFSHNLLSLQVAGSAVKASKSGNVTSTEGSSTTDINRPLPKRVKKK